MVAVLAHPELADYYDLVATPATGIRIVCAALVRKGLLRGPPDWIDRFPDALRLQTNDLNDPQAPGISVSLPGFSRPVLHLQLALRDDEPLTEVFVTHLKSKLPTRIDSEPWFKSDPATYKPHATAIGSALSTIRRTAEAAALRVLLTTVMKGTTTPVIVIGDVNDGQHSNTLNILTEQPTYLVGDSRAVSTVGFTPPKRCSSIAIPDVYYTHVHNSLRESLDHILVSEQFYDNSRRRLWLFDGLTIDNDHLNTEDHRATGTGDHGIVKVSFRYRPRAAL